MMVPEMAEKPERITRQLTPDEKRRHAEVRQQVMKDFPPTENRKHAALQSGIAAQLRQARKSEELTYEAVAEQAGLRSANTVKDVEFGRNKDIADIQAIADALGLKLELVQA